MFFENVKWNYDIIEIEDLTGKQKNERKKCDLEVIVKGDFWEKYLHEIPAREKMDKSMFCKRKFNF